MKKPTKIVAIVAEGQEIKGDAWNVPLKIICYSAGEMDTYLAQKDKEISELVGALETIITVRNSSHRDGAVGKCTMMLEIAESALNKHKTINE